MLTELTPFTTYSLEVAAVNDGGTGQYSTPLTVETLQDGELVKSENAVTCIYTCRPIACDITFGHFRIRPFGHRAMLCDAGGQKCIAVIERKALNLSLFTNASDYSNKTCTERSMCLYLTNMVVLLE